MLRVIPPQHLFIKKTANYTKRHRELPCSHVKTREISPTVPYYSGMRLTCHHLLIALLECLTATAFRTLRVFRHHINEITATLFFTYIIKIDNIPFIYNSL